MKRSSKAPVLEEVVGDTARIVLNRPERLNSFDYGTLVLLHQALEQCFNREEVRVIILSGNGSAFCAGAEVSYLISLRRKGDFPSIRKMLEVFRAILLLIQRLPQVVIAQMDGVAVDGGLNLALACDFRIASKRTLFGYPFHPLGLCPEVGTAWLLPALIGPAKALELAASENLWPAERLRELGLATFVLDSSKLEQETKALARRMSQFPPLVIRSLKRVSSNGQSSTFETLDQEIESRLRCLASLDCDEGFQAFTQNRLAHFKGR